MLKKLSLRVKLQGGFIIVNLIFLAVGIVGALGISKTVDITNDISFHEKVTKQILLAKNAHLQWVRNAGEFQRDENLTELNVEKDPGKCDFGKWYYGDERKKAEAGIPAIASLLRELEDPHKKLHESAKELEGILKKGKEYRKDATKFFETETTDPLKKLQKILDQIEPMAEQAGEQSKISGIAQAEWSKWISHTLVIIGSAVALIMGIFL
ncbi:MAG: CZB domain-containing protein, partial [Deltaproteobacteria bacterium]|nr:CZB domain-containing protein [Deltaproteobacteria bacterium]